MRQLALAIALSAAAACGGGSPTSPSGQTEQFTWTVNGQAFSASSNGMTALRSSGADVSLTGGNCSSGAFLSMIARNAAVGTFPVSNQGISVSWIPDARTSANQEHFDAPGIAGFNSPIGSGTVTITSLTNDWISGNFNVVATPLFTNQDKTAKTITGSFDLRFRDRTIC